MLKLLLFAFLLLPTASTFAIRQYNAGDTLHVFALSGLRLRDKPGGNVLTAVPYGSQVIVLENTPSDREERVDGIAGHWVSISFSGKNGYIFDGYLSILPAPNDNVKDMQAYCKRYFQPVGKPIEIKSGEEESLNEIYIQYHVFRNLLIEYKSNGYYESSSERMGIDPSYRVSAEEIFLLGRAIFREEVAESIAKMEKGEFNAIEEGGAGNRKSDKNYYQFVPLSECKSVIYALFTEGCSEEFSIGQFDYVVFLRRGGGC